MAPFMFDKQIVGRHEAAFDEALGPGLHQALRIGIMPVEQAAKVAAVVARIDEGIDLRLRRDREYGSGQPEMLEMQRRDDQQLGRALRELDLRHRVAEHIVHPAHIARRRQRQLRLDQPQVVAVARAQHQPVRPERDRRRIAVARLVANGQIFHAADPPAVQMGTRTAQRNASQAQKFHPGGGSAEHSPESAEMRID